MPWQCISNTMLHTFIKGPHGLVVRSQIVGLIFNPIFANIASSKFEQMENVNSHSIFNLQNLSNGILEVQFGSCLLFTLLFKMFGTFLGFLKWLSLGSLGIPFLALSHTCEDVLESYNIFLALISACAPTLVASLRLGLP